MLERFKWNKHNFNKELPHPIPLGNEQRQCSILMIIFDNHTTNR
ncbi:hypothetical protein [Neobacillus sp. 19]